MTGAVALYGRGEHQAALDAWRDVKVAQFRGLYLGKYLWHSSFVNIKRSDWHVGRDVEGYSEVDRWGDRGAPGTKPPINWISDEVEHNIDAKYTGYGWYLRYNSLAGAFYATGDPIYLQKWFEVTADFALNQKRMITEGDVDPELLPFYGCKWDYRDFGSSLFQAHRVMNILKSIGVFTKSLTPADREIPWGEVNAANDLPVAQSDLAAIPSRELALIAISLMMDHPEALIGRYVEGGAIPNQRKEGLLALLSLSLAFPEFKLAAELRATVTPTWEAFTRYWFLPDGADMEQSFNYNAGDVETTHNLLQLFGDQPLPEWLARAKAGCDMYRRLRAALLLPTGGAPQVGNNHIALPPETWRGGVVAREWRAEMVETLGGVPAPLERQAEDPLVAGIIARLWGDGDVEPAFTSIAFPYMGYTMMRDGWDPDSLALFFMGSYRTSGHINADVNGVQVVAYERPMMVYSGPPTYTAEGYLKTAPPNFATYASEPSSHKVNTVLVDGWSQKRDERKAPTSVTGSPWHTSERFDYTQRVYDGGYRKCVPPSNRLATDHSVTHERAVWFVKPAKLWVIADTMRNSGDETRTYSQVWNFPPRVDEERRPVNGFAEDQVGFDAAARRISTSDPDAPNVHLYHFGVDELSYEKYYGETEPTVIEPAGEGQNPVLGWYARFIADAVPAVDIHATWRGGAGASTLITVIVPSSTDTPPVAEARELPGGFEMSLTDGQKLGLFIADEAQELRGMGVSVEARSLLVHSDDRVTGIAFGGESGYEFEVRDREVVPTHEITAPTGFAWVETPEGIAPDHHPE